MSLLKRAGDLVYTFRFLKLLVTKFENTEAFKLGLIDKDGKKLRKSESSEDKSAYTPFHRLVFNIKKLMAKVPGGSSTLASYGAALYLIKEKYGVSESQIEKGLKELGFDMSDFLGESSQWFVLEDGRLSPGQYRVRHEKVLNKTLDEFVKPKDAIIVQEGAYPVGSIFGLNIYEAIHKRTNQTIYITIDELLT